MHLPRTTRRCWWRFQSQGPGQRQELSSCRLMPRIIFLLLGFLALCPTATIAWPYVDCSGSNPSFMLDTVTAHFDPTNKIINLALQGNFTSMYQYPAAETSAWRASIVTTIMGTQLHRSEGPACSLIAGGCPTTPGPGSIATNFSISQTAPFAELMVSMQIISAANQTIVCLAVLLEQNMDEVNTAVTYLPLVLALYSGAVSLVSIVMRATVGNGFMSSIATYGLPSTSEAISVHTPGLFDIVFYTQFMVMTGQLSINYPSFYLTFTSLFHWSFLEFRNSFAGNGPENSTYILTYGGAGSVNQIKGAQYSGSNINLERRLLPDRAWDYDYTMTLPTTTIAAPAMKMTHAPKPTIFRDSQYLKRDLLVTTNQVQVSPSATLTSSPASTTTSSSESTVVLTTPDESSSTSTLVYSTKSKSRTLTVFTETTMTTYIPTATTTTTPARIIPTITNPFNKNNWGSRQYNVSRFGMEAYAASIGAFPSDLFLCTFINTVMAAGASLFLSAFLLVVVWFNAKESHQKGKTLQHASNFVAGNLLRIWSLFYTPLALSAMYQLTISGNTLLMSIASVSLIVFSVGAIILLTWRILRASTRLLLFEDLGTLLRYGPLYNTLAEEGTLFFLVNLLTRFLWGLAVAMLSAYGIAQVAVLILVELGYIVVIGIKWPFSDSADNKFHLLLGFVRIVITSCSTAYLYDLNTSPEVRQLFGYIQMALHLAVFIVMFALILWNTIQVFLFWQSQHRAAWRGPTKSYSFEDTQEAEHGWVITGRPVTHQPEPRPLDPMKSRRYTVQPYASVSDLGVLPEEELLRNRSLYRHTHQPSGYHRSKYPSDEDRGLAVDLRSESIIPLSSSPGPMSARSLSPLIRSLSVESLDGPAIPLQPTQLSSVRFQPPAESYARTQRLTHQQAAGTPDLRTRRMSEIFKDGGYLYEQNGNLGSASSTTSPTEEKSSMFQSIKESLGGLISLSKRSVIKKPVGDGSKPKAFEVMRPPRPPPVAMDTTDDLGSHMGDDNLRELNSIGISRFFQESGRNNDRNRSLFVANPEAMVSQTTSFRSSISGLPQAALPNLYRTISTATAASIHTLGHRNQPQKNVSSDLTSLMSGIGAPLSETGSRRNSGSRRPSLLKAQQFQQSQQGSFARNSVEGNIAEALSSETRLKLQGGGTLKVSKGPEKAVQYWRKESGQYVGSCAGDSVTAGSTTSAPGSAATSIMERKPLPLPLATPPLLLLPTTRGSFFDQIQIDTSCKGAPSIKSRAGSRPESPTESHQSSNVAVSAGRMHEILDRMFSDQDDEDSDTISEGDETCSTFSGRVSATIMALQQKREQEESFADAQSMYRVDTLEPVLERYTATDGRGGGGEVGEGQVVEGASVDDGGSSSRPGARRTVSASSRAMPGTLMRTFSGPTSNSATAASSSLMAATLLRPSKSGSLGRPLAQTPLHTPSVLPFSGSTTSLQLDSRRDEPTIGTTLSKPRSAHEPGPP